LASVVFHFYNQLIKTGEVNLFKSHKNDYKNGEQTRDFIYVDDLINVMLHFHDNEGKINNGLYNIGTGNARTYNDLAKAIFKAVGKDPLINYIDTPEDIREKYQYFTEADMTKVKSAGYEKAFISLEETVAHYVNEYLAKGNKVYTGE